MASIQLYRPFTKFVCMLPDGSTGKYSGNCEDAGAGECKCYIQSGMRSNMSYF